MNRRDRRAVQAKAKRVKKRLQNIVRHFQKGRISAESAEKLVRKAIP